MTTMKTFGRRITSILLTLAVLFTTLPMAVFTASAAQVNSSRTADRSTMDSWKEFFPITGEISTENAGGVWMDKSVFTDASPFASLGITQDNPDSFLVALSTMAANMSITGTSFVPTDTLLILDISGSMNDNSGNNDVAEELVEAANESIATLLSTNKYNRVGIVLYSGPTIQGGNASNNDAVVILPLNRYTPASNGEYLSYTVSERNNSTTESVSVHRGVRIENTNTAPSSVSKNVEGGTYIQKGIIYAMNQFIASTNSVTVDDPQMGNVRRKPVVVLMSDGAPTVGSSNFTNPTGINLGDGTYTNAALGFVSQLSIAYAKAKIEEKYGTDALFYTLGLGLGNDGVAISVMDPENSKASTAVDDFWNDIQTNRRGQITFAGYNRVAVGQTVSLGNNVSVTKIATALEQHYVDQYFEASGSSGDLAEELKRAFEDIVGSIQLQSSYYPTLISENEELSGYVSFVDRIGQYMEVTDIKGILINDQLFSGACLASNFVEDGGALGTYNNPSALGLEMVSAVKVRLGLESDEVAATLISLAYENGQLSYTNDNDYSNYIGWYANKAGKFLGFYHEGVTVLPSVTGNADTDPAFLIKSYGYLGAVDASHGVSESDMMYATVQVREDIATGEQLVTFAVPAALIPTVTYNVTLDEHGTLSDLAVSGATKPIRLVYEVALDSRINPYNLKEFVSSEYLADPHNVNADGSVNFYSNQWDHENKAAYGTVNTYGYFNPSRQNDKYYYLEDTPVYSNTNGTLYMGDAQPAEGDTLYRAYKVYKNNGILHTETVYRELSAASKETAVRNPDGSWYVPKGNVHVNTDGYTVHKTENLTGTLTEATIPFVDTHNHTVNDLGYQFYVGASLGNNGKLTITPETGIKLTKALAEGVADTGDTFLFDLFNETNPADDGSYAALLLRADGSEKDLSLSFQGGKATVELMAGDILYIGGLTAGQTFRIEERETAKYLATVNEYTVTVLKDQILPVSFVNDLRGTGNLTVTKEITHDFGVNYQIPSDKIFTIEVTLSGIGVSNATFDAEHSNGTYTKISTDANGKFTVQLKHNEKFEVFGLPAGTQAVVVEQTPSAGFTPSYWDNGAVGDGIVTVVKNSTVSVIVFNDYQAAEVYPVNVTVSGNKALNGRPWDAGDVFNFKLEKLLPDGTWQQLGATAQATLGNTSFAFTDAFQSEKYTQSGTYYYRVVEIEPASPIGGITYDKTVHSFSVIVGDANMDGKLEITQVKTDRPETTQITENNGNWNVSVSFTNTYSTSGSATVTIDVDKIIDNQGGSEKSLAGYTFGLYDAVTDAQVGSLLTTTERGFARFVLTYNAAEIGAGNHTYTYVLKEVAPNSIPAGWTYSAEEIPVTVEVVDNGDGTISAVIYEGAVKPADADNSLAAAFTNVYNPADAQLTIDFVGKQLSGRDLVAGEFTFEVQTQSGATVLSGTNNAAGKVTFNDTLKFQQVGTYFYNIVETSADGKGVVTDKTAYRIMVTVTDADGQLSASYVLLNATGDAVVFRNSYTATSVSHVVEGEKTLRGRTLINDEFTFLLTELTVDGTAVSNPRTWTAKNRNNGSVQFPQLTYTKAGTYVYRVEESVPAGGKVFGIVYDQTRYKVTVVVTDNGEGALEIASETVALLNNAPAASLIFLNEYKADPTWAQLVGNKQLTGKVNNALVGGEFEFELYNSNQDWEQGSLKETVENGLGGTITFTKIDFETAGDQYFLVREKNGSQTIDGTTYDDTVYRVWIHVSDDLKGQLHATVHLYDGDGIPQNGISFVNVYQITGGATVPLSGQKILSGRDWKQGDSFTFHLYSADESFLYDSSDLASVVHSATVSWSDSDKNYLIPLNYTAQDAGQTFYYVLAEQGKGETVNGLTYSSAEYRIKVVVEDDNRGGIKTTVTVENATTSTLNFLNEYHIVVGTSVQLEATKELDGKDLGNLKFSFNLVESDANKTVGALLQTKENSGKFVSFDSLSYLSAGDYYYLISEQNAGQTVNGITYDSTAYHVHVKVTDLLDGTLSNTVTVVNANDGATVSSMVFVNRYRVSGSDTVELSGTKTFEGRDWTDSDTFIMELYEADASFGIVGTSPLATATADSATGKFLLNLTYGADDLGNTYYYVIKEQNAGQRIDGVTYSSEEYRITVTVQDGGDGTVKAEATADGVEINTLNFTNVYSADNAFVKFQGTKTLNGTRELQENEFSFDLFQTNASFEVDGAALQSVKNDANGKFSFASVEFSAVGTYFFLIRENASQPLGGVTYDASQYHVTVTVTDDGTGNLVASYTLLKVNGEESQQATEISFVNEYLAQATTVVLKGNKVLDGRTLKANEFSFLLYETDNTFAIDGKTPVQTVGNGADGTFTFEAISFARAGTFYLVVAEDGTVDAENVVFDKTRYHVTVTVTDDGKGNLIASDPVIVAKGSEEAQEAILFVNTYVPNPKTGDNSAFGMWLILLLVSGGAVTTLGLYSKKRRLLSAEEE